MALDDITNCNAKECIIPAFIVFIVSFIILIFINLYAYNKLIKYANKKYNIEKFISNNNI
jgi:hypothetical protein